MVRRDRRKRDRDNDRLETGRGRKPESWAIPGGPTGAEASPPSALQTGRNQERLVVSKMKVEPQHAVATQAGRYMGMLAARGSVFTDMHSGNFLFDGEYPIVTDIGKDIAGDDILLAIKSD